MKKSILLIFALFFFMMSCSNRNEASKNVKSQSASEGTFVEILYFHSDMRCKNCYAMEKGVSELLDDQFKEEVKDGKIIFKTIDITTPEGEQIADNYGVTWSSLYLNNWKDGKEEMDFHQRPALHLRTHPGLYYSWNCSNFNSPRGSKYIRGAEIRCQIW